MFVLISYDIMDDKRRYKLAKALVFFGDRVQLSVFECNLEKPEYIKMTSKITKIINNDEDSVRIYKICVSCKAEVCIYGCGEVCEDPDLVVV